MGVEIGGRARRSFRKKSMSGKTGRLAGLDRAREKAKEERRRDEARRDEIGCDQTEPSPSLT